MRVDTVQPALYLVDFLLGVVEQVGEVLQRPVVEDGLRLVIRARHDVAHRPESGRLHLHLPDQGRSKFDKSSNT